MTSGRSPGRQPDEAFERRLWRFILVAYASGENVAGVWYLTGTDRYLPDFRVAIERAGAGLDGPTTPGRTPFQPGGTSAFSRRLRAFVLEQFARGSDVVGTWTLRYQRVHLPDWDVRISMHADGETVEGARSPGSGR